MPIIDVLFCKGKTLQRVNIKKYVATYLGKSKRCHFDMVSIKFTSKRVGIFNI